MVACTWVEGRVGHMHVASRLAAHHLGGAVRFFQPLLGCAARAHAAGREIEHAGPVTELGQADQSSAAGLLHVVRMGGQGEGVYRLRVIGIGKGVANHWMLLPPV